MDNLKLFMKENKIKRENVRLGASSSLRDENGEKVLWEIRALSTAEDEKIREECLRLKDTGALRVDYGAYLKKMAAASVVYPPMYNAQLQDSYGVKTPEELLVAMIDNPGEYQEFVKQVQKINGFDVKLTERVEKAKN